MLSIVIYIIAALIVCVPFIREPLKKGKSLSFKRITWSGYTMLVLFLCGGLAEVKRSNDTEDEAKESQSRIDNLSINLDYESQRATDREKFYTEKLDGIRKQLMTFNLKLDGDTIKKALNYYEAPLLMFNGGSSGTHLENVTFRRVPATPSEKNK